MDISCQGLTVYKMRGEGEEDEGYSDSQQSEEARSKRKRYRRRAACIPCQVRSLEGSMAGADLEHLT